MNTQLFNTLPEFLRAEIKEELLKHNPELLRQLPAMEKKGQNVFVLSSLFIWSKSKQGFAYWQKVNRSLKAIIINSKDIC